MTELNRRILVIDDTPTIHEDFRKILGSQQSATKDALQDAKNAFFGTAPSEPGPVEESFDIDSAYQGEEGHRMTVAAVENATPYAMAFVDVRMPPGWDGVQTIKEMWKVDPDLQIVICTAYSDYSWSQTIEELGQTDRLLILKKPFDSAEIRQLAAAMTEKWSALRRERDLIDSLREAEAQARSYASSLETMNQALMSAQATSEKAAERKSEFLVQLSARVHENLTELLGEVATHLRPETETALESSRDIVRMLDQILDLNQIEAGTLELEHEPVALLDVIRAAFEHHRAAARSRNVELSVEVPEAIPAEVQTDPARLQQLTSVLVENAILCSHDSTVVVHVTFEDTADWKTSILRIAVRDHGPVIPETFEPRIFEPFAYQRKGTAGVGIGLPLGRQLARLMGGEISHRRTGEDETTFELRLEVGNVAGVPMVAPQLPE